MEVHAVDVPLINVSQSLPNEVAAGPDEGQPVRDQEQPAPSYLSSVFFVLGIGLLMPWNALISVVHFYTLAFTGIPFGFIIPLAYILSMSVTTVLLVAFPRRNSKHERDILIGFFICAMVTILLPFRAPSQPTIGVFSNVMPVIAAVAVIGVASAFIQTSLFGVATLFSSSGCMTALNAGTGLGGVIVALLRMVSLLAPTDSAPEPTVQSTMQLEMTSMYRCFFACACACLICIAEVISVCSSRQWQSAMHDADHPIFLGAYLQTKPQSLSSRLSIMDASIREVELSFWTLFITYAVTVGLSPTFLLQMRAQEDMASDPLLTFPWLRVLVVFMFSVGDWLGKSANRDSFGLLLTSPARILGASVLRIAFCPLAIYATSDKIFQSDTAIFTFAGLFGLTNGLLTSAAFLQGHNGDESDKTGKVRLLGLTSGVALGALLWPVFHFLAAHSG